MPPRVASSEETSPEGNDSKPKPNENKSKKDKKEKGKKDKKKKQSKDCEDDMKPLIRKDDNDDDNDDDDGMGSGELSGVEELLDLKGGKPNATKRPAASRSSRGGPSKKPAKKRLLDPEDPP